MATVKTFLNTSKFDPLVLARILVIFDLVAILFSPPLSTFSEIALLVIFITSSPVRLKILAATKQPLVKASLVFYLVISIATLWSAGTLSETFGMWWGWRKLLLVVIPRLTDIILLTDVTHSIFKFLPLKVAYKGNSLGIDLFRI